MLYVVNAYRYLTRTSGEAAQSLGEIECAARLTATAVVNNSNLAEITTAEDISRSAAYARETALQYQIPLLFTAAREDLADAVRAYAPGLPVYPVRIYVKKPWEA